MKINQPYYPYLTPMFRCCENKKNTALSIVPFPDTVT